MSSSRLAKLMPYKTRMLVCQPSDFCLFCLFIKRQKDIQSYEQWLASKEAPAVVEATPTRRGKEDVDTTTTVTATTATAKGTRTMDDIIRSITQRRQQQLSQQLHQHQRDVISNEMWLTMDNADIHRLLT